MNPLRAIFITALVTILCTPLAALAGQGTLTGNVEAHRVVTADNGREVYLPADEARPKDVIEYRLTYTNGGETTLRNVTVVDPVPVGTEYIVDTAARPHEGVVEFSVDDGETYHTWPILIKKTTADGKEIEVEATPDMVTHIRWTVANDLEPETAITFTYRAKVK